MDERRGDEPPPVAVERRRRAAEVVDADARRCRARRSTPAARPRSARAWRTGASRARCRGSRPRRQRRLQLRRPPRRRRRPRGAARPSPPRSIFGARLRTRCPQYGHSVTYGLTSDPQFLQTTKRSGSLTDSEDTPAGGDAESAGSARAVGLLDDLAHDLAQVVVGLVDDELARGAVAAARAGPRSPSSSSAEPRSWACSRSRSSTRRAARWWARASSFGRSTSSPSSPCRAASHLFSSSISYG